LGCLLYHRNKNNGFDYYGNFKENKFLNFEKQNGNLRLDLARLKMGSKLITDDKK